MEVVKYEYQGTNILYPICKYQFLSVYFHIIKIHLRRSYKSRNKFIHRMLIQIHWFTNLLDHSIFHDYYAVCHCHGFYLVMRDIDGCTSKISV